MGAEDIARWLDTLGGCVPPRPLGGLKARILATRIDGDRLSAIFRDCRFCELDADGLTPLHISRVRKAWKLDHERSPPEEEAAPGGSARGAPGEPSGGLWQRLGGEPGGGGERGGGHPPELVQDLLPSCSWECGSAATSARADAPELVASAVGRECGSGAARARAGAPALVAAAVEGLARWAGFDPHAALDELAGGALSPRLCEEARRCLAEASSGPAPGGAAEAEGSELEGELAGESRWDVPPAVPAPGSGERGGRAAPVQPVGMSAGPGSTASIPAVPLPPPLLLLSVPPLADPGDGGAGAASLAPSVARLMGRMASHDDAPPPVGIRA
ncbi:unnamed protein product [Prorocentrum cordatum]|uniref:Inositol-pentakisphosphate 2-kinase n=1 Tax=Prorocentrum cordatum TaxID=2364126 RepID=A0ABN9VFX4_9DINO|nr:unnamed protein product [Polarella glacialis]